ncbi:cupin domain-containing protein [Azospirillum sp. sgz302134]
MTFTNGTVFTVTFTKGLLLAAGILAAASGTAMAQDKAAAPGPVAKTLLEATTSSDGVPLAYPTGKPQITARLVELPPGGEIVRHRHPMPLFVYIVEGELTINGDGLEPRRYKAGDAYMELATWHRGTNETDKPVRLLSVYSGAEGLPLSERPH